MALRRIAVLMLSALLSMTGVIVMAAAVADDAQACGVQVNDVAFSPANSSPDDRGPGLL